MPGTIFEVVDTMHCEPMRDGTGRIRTYMAGEYCTDPWGRDLVVLYANKFKYAPPGVSPKFKGDECDDTLAEVALAMQSDKTRKKMAAKLTGKNNQKRKHITGEDEGEVLDADPIDDEDEILVTDDIEEENSSGDDLVIDDLEETPVEETPKKKKKSKKKA